MSLNLLVTDGSARFVARIHRPSVTPARLGAIQDVRRHLHGLGVPCTEPMPTLRGEPWAVHEGQLVEVEPFIDAPDRMNTLERVSSGLPTLGRIHADLLALAVDSAGAEAAFANYVPATGLRELVRVASDRVRSWQPTPGPANEYLPGLSRMSCTTSVTLLAGTDGLTATTLGEYATRVTGAKSLIGSYGTLA